jgi:hypothetical protein
MWLCLQEPLALAEDQQLGHRVWPLNAEPGPKRQRSRSAVALDRLRRAKDVMASPCDCVVLGNHTENLDEFVNRLMR